MSWQQSEAHRCRDTHRVSSFIVESFCLRKRFRESIDGEKMSETSSDSMMYPRPATRFKSLLTVAFGTLIFLGVVGLISKGLRVLMQARIPYTLRDRAALTISGSALGELAVLILLLAYLKSRGKTLHSLGFGQSSPLRGWIISAMVTGLYAWLTLGALRGQAQLTEASAFHAYTSLVASLSAGIVEEIFSADS